MANLRSLKVVVIAFACALGISGQTIKPEVVLLAKFDGKTKEGLGIDFSPNGKYFLLVDEKGTRSVWNTVTHTVRHSLSKKSKMAYFSHDEKSIFIPSKKESQIVDAESGKVKVILDRNIVPWRESWSPDDSYVVGWIGNFTAGVFDTQNGKLKQSFVCHKKKKLAIQRFFDFADDSSALFTPDGKRLLTSVGDSDAELWDIETGALLFTFTQSIRSPYTGALPKLPEITDIEVSSDGKWILTSGYVDARLWNAATGKLVQQFEGWQGGMTFSPDSNYLGLVNEPGQLSTRLLDLRAMKYISLESKYAGRYFRWNPDGRTILTDRTIDEVNKEEAYLFSVETGNKIGMIKTTVKYCFDLVSTCISDSTSFMYSPNGKILMASDQKQIKLLDSRDGSVLTSIDDGSSPARWSPDGNFILAKDKQKDKVGMWKVSIK